MWILRNCTNCLMPPLGQTCILLLPSKDSTVVKWATGDFTRNDIRTKWCDSIPVITMPQHGIVMRGQVLKSEYIEKDEMYEYTVGVYVDNTAMELIDTDAIHTSHNEYDIFSYRLLLMSAGVHVHIDGTTVIGVRPIVDRSHRSATNCAAFMAWPPSSIVMDSFLVGCSIPKCRKTIDVQYIHWMRRWAHACSRRKAQPKLPHSSDLYGSSVLNFPSAVIPYSGGRVGAIEDMIHDEWGQEYNTLHTPTDSRRIYSTGSDHSLNNSAVLDFSESGNVYVRLADADYEVYRNHLGGLPDMVHREQMRSDDVDNETLD